MHMAQLMPPPLTFSCFSKIQIVFSFLVAAHPGSPGKRAVKRACVCVCVCVRACVRACVTLAGMICETAYGFCVQAIRKMIERKKKTVEGRLVRHSVTDDYADFGSQAYAPLTRIGVFRDRNSEQYVVKNKYLANYAGRYFQRQ